MSQDLDYKNLMTQALRELQTLRSRVRELEASQAPGNQAPGSQAAPPEPIAIVGMGCRLPGQANSPAQFWQNLCDGLDAITPTPPDRWPPAAIPGSGVSGSGLAGTGYGGFIGHLREFDAAFFGIAPKEAAALDPQQRLLLEVNWEALEQAGIIPNSLSESNTGIFVGLSSNDYSGHLLKRPTEAIDAYLATGNSHSTAAGRIAFTLGLQGPAIAVDTACSSSLVAVHLACQSLRLGECDLAIASGANRILAPEFSINFARANMLAADGRCKTFDASADGFVRAEGAGAVVLKRLSAVGPTEPIFAIIRGSAVNQDGRSSGLTVPNGPAQQRVIQQALAQAGLNPSQVDYIEAHGTGTALGDPIELGALQQVFGGDRPELLKVGSAKTNLGHLEAAAGIAGLIKTALSLYHRQIPPHLHFHTGNPNFNWANSSIAIPTEPTPLSDNAIAGVSSFGFSGTNAHVILAAAPNSAAAPPPRPTPEIFALSAKSPKALQALKAAYRQALTAADWTAICCAARRQRSQFDYRDAALVDNREAAIDFLSTNSQHQARKPKIAFLFTGQGSQYSGMGKHLYDRQPIFRQELERCAQLFQPYLDVSLIELLFNSQYGDRLDQTQYAQPALFAIEYGLAKLWQAWGIQPDILLGHSLGEYVAAQLAGVFSLEDAVKLVGSRAKLMQELPALGKMVMIEAPVQVVRSLLASIASPVEISAINSHKNTVISGATKAVDQCLPVFADRQIQYQSLKVPQAFHSVLMEAMLMSFQQTLSQVKLSPPQIAIISDFTGELVGAEMATVDYWCRHLRYPVQFQKGMKTLSSMGCNTFIEIGAKSVLIDLGQEVLAQGSPPPEALWLPSLTPQQPQQMLLALTDLYRFGAGVNWPAVHSSHAPAVIAQATALLPTYPFQRQRHWLDSYDTRQLALATNHPLLGQQLAIADAKRFFAQPISLSQPQYLADHLVFDRVILPGAAYLELAIAAAMHSAPAGSAIELHNSQLQRPLQLGNPSTILQTMVEPGAPEASWSIHSQSAGRNFQDHHWLMHASGTFLIQPPSAAGPQTELPEITINQYRQKIQAAEYYQQLAGYGINYAAQFQAIQTIWYEPTQAIAQIKLPDGLTLAGYHLHPVLLDACFQAIGATMLEQPPRFAFLPTAVAQVQFYQPAPAELWATIQLTHRSATALLADLTLITDAGAVVAQVTGLQLKAVKPSHLQKLLGSQESRPEYQPEDRPAENSTPAWQDWLYQVAWQPQAGPIPAAAISPAAISPAAIPAIIAKLAPEFTQLLAQPHIPAYANHLEQLETASVQYIVNALVHLGLTHQPGDRLSSQQVIQQLKIQPAHHRLSQRLLQILVEAGYLSGPGGTYQVLHWPAQLMPVGWPEAARSQADTVLLERCGSQLAPVLRGDVNPLQLLFPNGDWSALTALYQDSPGTQITNQLAQQALLEIAIAHPGKLRILEIGAGTGGTTAHLLAALTQGPAADREFTYRFTDISPIFLSKAKQRFQAYDQVQYQLLNIEQPGVEQGFEPGSFDIVIAANALHATKDLEMTARHVQQLLKPGGHLILVEGVKPARWLDLIFGLTEGWWRFSDRRSEYPLISADEWRTVLQSQGFAQAEPLQPLGAMPPGLDQQAVIVAQTPVQAAQHWLIIDGEATGWGQAIAQQLAAAGQSSAAVDCPPWNLRDRLAETDQVVYVSGVQPGEFEPELLLAQSQHWLEVIQSLTGSLAKTPRLTLVTADGPGASSLLGIGQVVALEYPQLQYRSILLPAAQIPQGQIPQTQIPQAQIPQAQIAQTQIAQDPIAQGPIAQGQAGLDRLILELLTPGPETRIQLNSLGPDPQRRVQRLQRYQLPQPKIFPNPEHPQQLAIAQKGSLRDLEWRPMQRLVPAAGEVEIAVETTGLNLIDVLDALNLLPFERDWFGVECAGTVVAVGSGVQQLKVGDAVLALAPGSFQDYVTVAADWVVQQPQRLGGDHAAAATIPANFLTAYYGLHALAQVKAGDRLLIHAAASGTGMAAVQIAQWLGAEVYATASPGKWDALRAMGVEHIFHSRNLAFAEEIGPGTIDLVFNALSGDFIPKSLALLKPGGQFIEIGKREIWTAQQVSALRPDVQYHIVDLMQTAQQQPQQIQQMLQALGQLIQTQKIQPLPQQIFSSAQVIEAFRAMQQAQHIGKIVVSRRRTICPNSSYLITGGFGGLGLKVAQWLSHQGAKQLVLAGHRPPSPQAEAAIAELRGLGVEVQTATVDVCDFEALKALIHSISRPLDGVFHAAGQLDDGTIQQLTPERLLRVMRPKVLGAWHLHQLTHDLRYFVCFSSAASLLGSPGQANHVAANCFLDAIAQYRRQLGLPALSINWGAWSEIGAAAHRGVTTQMAQRGIGEIPPAQGIEVLAQLLAAPQLPAQVGVVPIRWEQVPQSLRQNPFFQQVQAATSPPALQPPTPTNNLRDRLPKTNPTAYLTQYLQTEFAQVLGLNQQRPDPNLGFFDMGMDSLMTVELQNRLESAIGHKIATSTFFEHPTIHDLAKYLAEVLTQEPVPSPVGTSTQTNSLAQVNALSPIAGKMLEIGDSGPKALDPTTRSRSGVDLRPEASAVDDLQGQDSLPSPLANAPPPPGSSPPEIEQIEQELAALEALLNQPTFPGN